MSTPSQAELNLKTARVLDALEKHPNAQSGVLGAASRGITTVVNAAMGAIDTTKRK